MTPTEAQHALWRTGDLSYLLHETQERMRRAICASLALLFVLNCARRLGKSFLCCVLAIEMCLQKPGARVLYVAPTAKQVRTIITPIMRQILEDAPTELRPSPPNVDGIWRFPNGSEIHIVGVNNDHADDARGGSADLVIIDEAGMIDDLVYLIESIIKPMLLTTNGRIIMPSTPAPTPAHPFTEYCARAEAANAYAKYTIYDAPHVSRERADAFIAEGGGRSSSNVRREYFCEHVVDDALAIFPEFADGLIEDRPRPPHFVPIIVGDAGFHDLTFIIGGYHDFREAIDVIEWEWVGNKKLAREIDSGVSEKASAAWRATVARRYIDAPPQIVAELSANGAPWGGIAKTETDGPFMGAAVNGVRQRMKSRAIRISPACPNLIAHCRYGVWKKPGVDFERMDGFGHFDGCAALAYFERLVDRTTNPYPAIDPSWSTATHWMGDIEPANDRANLKLLAASARRRER